MKYKIVKNEFSNIQKFIVIDTKAKDEGENYIIGFFREKEDAQKEIDTLLEEKNDRND